MVGYYRYAVHFCARGPVEIPAYRSGPATGTDRWWSQSGVAAAPEVHDIDLPDFDNSLYLVGH